MTVHDPSPVEVELAPPVEVGRAGGHFWFSRLLRLEDRRLLCEVTLAEDKGQGEWPAALFLSEDAGATWRRTIDIPACGMGATALEPGHILLQPYELWPLRPGDRRNAGAQGTRMAAGARGEVRIERTPVAFYGFPRDYQDYNRDQLLVLANGTVTPLKDGRLLSTVYGRFVGDSRLSLCSVTSEDRGATWRYQALIAGADVAPGAREGPNEAAIARLADGRLLCVFRVAMRVPYWMSVSADEGAAWATPEPMAGVGSVKPQVLRLDNGLLLLSGGREGLFLWLCCDGEGRDWERLDLGQHHNDHLPPALHFPPEFLGGRARTEPAVSTSYTSLLPLGPDEALLSYDRLANGWGPAPGPHGEYNVVFCVRISVSAHVGAGLRPRRSWVIPPTSRDPHHPRRK